jgi:hypothetical protein
MKTNLRQRSMAGLVAGLFAVMTGCVATGGYEGDVGVSYGVDYYETYGYDYGHWHPGYHVAPSRGGHEDRARARAESRPSQPAYRPAPIALPAPSIPLRPRSH